MHARRVYSVLDWAADVGGLLGAISPFCVSLVYIFHYKSQYMFMMKELFVEAVPSNINDSNPTSSLSKKELATEVRKKMKNTTQWSCCGVLLMNLKLVMPKKLQICCFKRRPKDEL